MVDLEVFYLGHLKNFYTIQYNTTDHYADSQNDTPTFVKVYDRSSDTYVIDDLVLLFFTAEDICHAERQ